MSDKRIIELDVTDVVENDDFLAIDSVSGNTRRIKPIKIGATYEIEDGDHEFTLIGSNGYEHTVHLPVDAVSMTQAEYDALTPEQKADGTARFITDAESDVESELWSKVGRQTLDTDAQVLSNAVNELKGDMTQAQNDISELNSSLTQLVHTQSGSGAYGVNNTLQIDSNILNHSVIVICCGRYGYGNSIVLSSDSISAGFYANGIGAYINSSRHVTLKVSTSGLITVVETNDALNIAIIGIN